MLNKKNIKAIKKGFFQSHRYWNDEWLYPYLDNLNFNTKVKTIYFVEISLSGEIDITNENIDMFSMIQNSDIVFKHLKNKESLFVIDYSYEGDRSKEIINMIQKSVDMNNIDGKYVIFITGDMSAKQHKHSKNSIEILPLLRWSDHVKAMNDKELHNKSINDFFVERFNNCNKNFGKTKEKYFSSLSRVNRTYRFLATYLLYQSEIRNKALISHDKLLLSEKNSLYNFLNEETNLSKTQKQIISFENFLEKLPLVVDNSDFTVNWAGTPFLHIHDHTLFQIVNETHATEPGLFYSEKTFRPIFGFQPFLVYGQVGVNHHLKELGFKLYDEWFNLEFDLIEDHIQRYHALLNEVKRVCRYLDSLSRNEKIEWRFRYKDTLIFNFNKLIESTYNKNMIAKLFSQYV